MMRRPQIGVAVLLGGQSKRMGSPKENLPVPDSDSSSAHQTFLDRIVEQITDFPDKYLSVAYSEHRDFSGYEACGFTVIRDKYKDIGPMGGIVSVLEKAAEDRLDGIVVIAVDMPFVERKDINSLIESYEGNDGAVIFSKRGPEPLFGLYSVSSISKFNDSVSKGDYRIGKVIETLKITKIHLTDERILANVNTPEEYMKNLRIQRGQNGDQYEI